MKEVLKYEIQPNIARLIFDYLSEITKHDVEKEDLSNPDYDQTGIPIYSDPEDDDGFIALVWVFFDKVDGKEIPNAYYVECILENDEDCNGGYLPYTWEWQDINYEVDDYFLFVEKDRAYVENICRKDAEIMVAAFVNNYMKHYGITREL